MFRAFFFANPYTTGIYYGKKKMETARPIVTFLAPFKRVLINQCSAYFFILSRITIGAFLNVEGKMVNSSFLIIVLHVVH